MISLKIVFALYVLNHSTVYMNGINAKFIDGVLCKIYTYAQKATLY